MIYYFWIGWKILKIPLPYSEFYREQSFLKFLFQGKIAQEQILNFTF